MTGQLWTIGNLATLVYNYEDRDAGYNEIADFVRDDRIPYVHGPDGILIPLGGFQTCMPDLYNMAEAMEAMDRKLEEWSSR